MLLQWWLTLAGKEQPGSRISCQRRLPEARRMAAACLRILREDGQRPCMIIRGHAWTDGINHLRLY